MKKSSFLLLSAVAIILNLTSCESKTGTGALVGGGVGAGTGALIAGGKGAAIGGAVGIVGGAIVGHLLDEEDNRKVSQESPATAQRVNNGEQLTVNDIIALHKAGLSDHKICQLIDKTHSKYKLSASSIHRLERAGVSSKIIDHMNRT